MAHVPKTYMWISLWFLLTAPVMIWDAGYCLMRPRSMIGGDLHWIWKMYETYQEVDYVYGVKAFENGEGFASGAAILNLLETFANLLYLFTTYITPTPLAPLIGYTGATMTVSKTILYLAQEHFCGYCAVGHNDFWTTIGFWVLPNVLWIIFPSLIIRRLGSDILSSLRKTATTTASNTPPATPTKISKTQ